MRASRSFSSLRLAIILVLCVLTVSTLGYMLIEHLSLLDAVYEASTMMTTVGDATFSLSQAGRMFSILVMTLGIGSLLYTFGVVTEYVIEGHLSLAFRRRRMDSKIAALRDHYVVCGFGRVGSRIVEDLMAAGEPFVVVDEREESVRICLDRGYLTVEGDASSDDILREAGIPHARCLLVATDTDANNISITLTARHLSAKLFIVARANHAETEVKLKLAGADRVLSPYTIAGHRMANLALDTLDHEARESAV